MYQNILQQLQQMFSGGMQPGGISDMMYRQPQPGRGTSFIDGLIGGMPSGGQMMPAPMPNPVEPPGGWQYGGPGGNGQPPMAIGGSGPAGGMPVNIGGGEYSNNPAPGGGVSFFQVPQGPPLTAEDMANAQPMPMPTPGAGYHNPRGPGERPGAYGVEPGPGFNNVNPMPMPMPRQRPPYTGPAVPGNELPRYPGGNIMNPPALGRPQPGGGFTRIGNPGMGSRGFTPTGPITPPSMDRTPGERPGTYGRPMPMPTPGQGFKPPQMERPMPMPGATTRPVTGFKPRVTGGY